MEVLLVFYSKQGHFMYGIQWCIDVVIEVRHWRTKPFSSNCSQEKQMSFIYWEEQRHSSPSTVTATNCCDNEPFLTFIESTKAKKSTKDSWDRQRTSFSCFWAKWEELIWRFRNCEIELVRIIWPLLSVS